MPKEGQKSVSLPQYIWDYAETYFFKHECELSRKQIKSVTKLITIWIQESALGDSLNLKNSN